MRVACRTGGLAGQSAKRDTRAQSHGYVVCSTNPPVLQTKWEKFIGNISPVVAGGLVNEQVNESTKPNYWSFNLTWTQLAIH